MPAFQFFTALLLLWSCSVQFEGVSAQNDTRAEVRLVGGANRCEGRLERFISQIDDYGQACNERTGDAEARVVCRELDCGPSGAERVDPVQFGFSTAINIHATFGFSCNGDEDSLSECPEPGAICIGDNVSSAIAIRCGNSGASSVTSKYGILTGSVILCAMLFFKI